MLSVSVSSFKINKSALKKIEKAPLDCTEALLNAVTDEARKRAPMGSTRLRLRYGNYKNAKKMAFAESLVASKKQTRRKNLGIRKMSYRLAHLKDTIVRTRKRNLKRRKNKVGAVAALAPHAHLIEFGRSAVQAKRAKRLIFLTEKAGIVRKKKVRQARATPFMLPAINAVSRRAGEIVNKVLNNVAS